MASLTIHHQPPTTRIMETPSLLKPEHQRGLTFLLPLIAAGIGFLLLAPAYGRLKYAQWQFADKQALLSKNQNMLTIVAAYPHKSKARAVAPDSDEEPIAFLAHLSHLAQESGVELFGLQESAPSAPANVSTESASSVAAGNAPAPETSGGVREVEAAVVVEGDYASLLKFFARLERGERIVAVSDLHIAPSAQRYPRLTAKFTVTRFVAGG
jgi:hypothetical protein